MIKPITDEERLKKAIASAKKRVKAKTLREDEVHGYIRGYCRKPSKL